MTIQERIAYINARGKLLHFFFVHMYSNNTELFNSINDPFLNDVERMKYFIDRFNQYYHEEFYEFIVNLPLDADEHHENYDSDNVHTSYVHEVIMVVKYIKGYLGL